VGIEIERKFLVVGEAWKQADKATLMTQGYICSDPERIVRVRIDGGHAVLTIKGKTVGISRSEWEYPIPLADAQQMLDGLCGKALIQKYRYRLELDGLTWEVDEFLGENAGLVVAEIELESETQQFTAPSWLGQEVSHDRRYANAQLFKHPYCHWKSA